MMRKLFLMALAISLFMSLGAGSALAAKGGTKGSGKPCPPSSPVGQALGPDNPGAPNCGNGNGGDNGNGGGNTCPPSSPNAGGQPPCGHPGGGGGNPPPEPPAGNCEHADLVLLNADAKIVCLYLPPKGSLATKDKECPDALIATGDVLGLGACVFLPPAGA